MGWFADTLRDLDLGHPRIFVETGTFRGDGALRALEDFEFVYTIELDEPLYEYSKDRLDNEPNIKVLWGDSALWLKKLSSIEEPICFYLDAHWSGTGAYGRISENGCPVLRELSAISDRPYKDVVIIDDMRLIGKKSKSGDGLDWPITEFDWRETTREKILEVYPAQTYDCPEIDRLVLYR